uniref:Uncharacterized protein n=1 Tax=Sphaerodactylus townsendi TaxID=933632 RepID=A0ACB8F1V5_9SAUR
MENLHVCCLIGLQMLMMVWMTCLLPLSQERGSPSRFSLFTAFHSKQEFLSEHLVELRGIRYDSSLQCENSEYHRTLTPILEWLFKSSFQNSTLEGSCLRCSILQYRWEKVNDFKNAISSDVWILRYNSTYSYNILIAENNPAVESPYDS